MKTCLLVGFLVFTCVGAANSDEAVAQSPECRTVPLNEGGKPKPTKMCKDTNGQWVAAAPVMGKEIPATFRGKIVYEGTANGVNYPPQRQNSRNILGDLIGSALKLDGKPFSLAARYELEFDGNLVTGRYSGRSANGATQTGTMSGTRTGTNCQLFTPNNELIQATCDSQSFVAVSKSNPQDRNRWETRVDASSVEVVDYVERDRLQAIAAQQAKAEREAAAARYAALPNAGPTLTKKLDEFVRTDSQGWAFNQYNPGSIRNVKIVEGTIKSGSYVMRGDYTYNGGSEGWVLAKMAGSKLECIQFWDAVMGCRGLRTAEQGQAMRDATAAAVVGSFSGGGSSQGGQKMCRNGFGTGTPGTEQPC
ncbi:hypothetical protein [Blastomonas sp.]|uniref:hypothetical protein n=1 Tax=Blastomonas sp. TaxID=1909299 RepID=UPI002608D7C6|nr:hypothetical protein [Blastomonas sp.]MDM7958029.1 hypothetical protein [Blastomonas sp.]